MSLARSIAAEAVASSYVVHDVKLSVKTNAKTATKIFFIFIIIS